MKNIQYSVGSKYIVISRNVIQSKKYTVNKIIIGQLSKVTDKSLIFKTDHGIKRIWKSTISKLIDISGISIAQTQLFIDRIEGALV